YGCKASQNSEGNIVYDNCENEVVSYSSVFSIIEWRQVVKEYGVYVRANLESINIARPANFVLDAAGTIRFIHISSVQIEFASFDDILATLDTM
ncbi:MAG: hypothetical protein NTZ28_12980, partial [Nitrospirae bacterium]|nr:hypothetical protein [Nitrospirota bacterium]